MLFKKILERQKRKKQNVWNIFGFVKFKIGHPYCSGKHKIVSGRSNERLDFGSGTKQQ
jgi:hypothetical protein